MNIPNSIKEKIVQCAKYHEKSNKLENEIREWMYKNNLYNDTNIDQFIDAVVQTNNPDLFLLHMETDVDIGNAECYQNEFSHDWKD